MDDPRTIVLVEDLRQPPAQVWRALTDPVRLGQWLMPNDFVPKVGHEFTFRTSPVAAVGFSGRVAAKVLELIPQRRLALRWGDAGDVSKVDWTVTFTLEPMGAGTRLTLVHNGFDPDDPGQQHARKVMSGGWGKALRKLGSMGKTEMRRDFTITVLLPCAPTAAWDAVATGQGLSRWLMPTSAGSLQLGDVFTFQMKAQRGWDGMTFCEVIELDPGRELAMTYRGKATGDKAMRCAGIENELAQSSVRGIFAELDTILRFSVVADPDCAGLERTRLFVTQSGFTGIKMVLVSFVMQMGWRKLIRRRLPAALAEAASRHGQPEIGPVAAR